MAGNKVWFVGPNIFYHYYLTKDATEQKFINSLIPTTTKDNPAVTVQKEDLAPEEGSLKFNFTADGPWLGLVSYTYSPHWKAYLDGQPIKIDNLEDLMILDLVLPRLPGTEVLRRCRALRPDVPVLLSSGNVQDGLDDPEVRGAVAGALPKPYLPTDLLAAVDRVLEARAGNGLGVSPPS